MKFYKIILPVLFLSTISCRKNMTDLNTNTKAPSSVPSYTLFTTAQKNLSDAMATPNPQVNIFILLSQYYAQTTYVTEGNYQIDNTNLPQIWWGLLYRDALNNFAEAKKLIPTDVKDRDVARNQQDITDIMQVYAWSVLVNTFGNIPYTQALEPNKYPFPVYDDAKTVYYDLLNRLDTSIAGLNINAGSFGSNDLIYNGNVKSWLVFANSLKLKMSMLIADSDPTVSAKKVKEAVNGGVMSLNKDNALFNYLATPPNTNPQWTTVIQSGRIDFVIAESLADSLNKLNDPRRIHYFTTDITGSAYSGGVVGKSNAYANFSKPSSQVTAQQVPYIFMDCAETQFLLAEAAARGMDVPGTVSNYYNNGIKASMEYWGATTSEANAYLLNPQVAYATANGSTYKEKIGLQKWIALYTRGFDAWTELRRLHYPVLPKPVAAISDFPSRYRYPSGESTSNGINYKAAAAAIGGDLVTTKLFWNK
ncbi:MAG: SusD/RagB family nutrient-binding outer membrane lipoprotein [Ginsengibacter sp.]